MSTFKQMRDRIAADLRRSNLDSQIGNGINDAIIEAAKTRFYFNEMHVSFATVIGQEYYADLGVVEIDAAFYLAGTSRYGITVLSQRDMDALVSGSPANGLPMYISRYGGQIRVNPIPSTVMTIYIDGFGKLTPNPLAADGDTNGYTTDGELYIRALAKRNVFRDVIRDFGEARVWDSVAEDYKQQLVDETTMKQATGILRSIEF